MLGRDIPARRFGVLHAGFPALDFKHLTVLVEGCANSKDGELHTPGFDRLFFITASSGSRAGPVT